MCADLYGSQYTNSFIEGQIAATNEYFGGLSPNVENVYFTHGHLDPWRAMGIQNETEATILPGKFSWTTRELTLFVTLNESYF